MWRNQNQSKGVQHTNGNSAYERLATGLGWFSIALGLAEVAAPGTVANVAGIPGDSRNKNLLRSPLYGMRELAAGTGILTQSRRAPWLWSRVAGDVMDLASLGAAMRSNQSNRKRVAMALGAVAGVTALDVVCAQRLSRQSSSTNLAPMQPEIAEEIEPQYV